MRAFRYIAGAAVVALAVQCGTAEKQAPQKSSGAVPSVQSSPTVEKTAAPAPAGATAAQDTLVLIARLMEIPGKFAPNDLYNYVYIMKYRVTTVVKGAYAGQEILVGHYNPLIPRPRIKDRMAPFARGNVEQFERGARHRLTLVTPIEKVWNNAVEDDYVDSDLDKYYALTADVAP
jgi:hypothetical protein